MSTIHYTPAFLTGGTSAVDDYAAWAGISDGEFAITIDGTARSVTSLDFSSVTDMDDVATVMQTGIRALTSSTETVAWSTDHFIITSADTTALSAITVTSDASGGGTDVSGATASPGLNIEHSTGGAFIDMSAATAFEGQTFTIGADSVSAVRFSFFLKKFGSPTGNVTCKFYATDGAGKPTGAALGTSGTLDASTTTGSSVQYDFDFGTPVALTAATKYAAILEQSTFDGSNYLKVETDNAGGYAGGTAVGSADSGSTWAVFTTQDHKFKFYVNVEWMDSDTGNGTVTAGDLNTTGYDQNRVKVSLGIDSTDSDRLEPLTVNAANGALLIEA